MQVTAPPQQPKIPPKLVKRKIYENDEKCKNCGKYKHEHLANRYCPTN
jgi:ribosomal protein L32